MTVTATRRGRRSTRPSLAPGDLSLRQTNQSRAIGFQTGSRSSHIRGLYLVAFTRRRLVVEFVGKRAELGSPQEAAVLGVTVLGVRVRAAWTVEQFGWATSPGMS